MVPENIHTHTTGGISEFRRGGGVKSTGIPGLPRCKNLTRFSLFVSFCFAVRYCLKCFLFPLFYVIREFHRFFHRGKAGIPRTWGGVHWTGIPKVWGDFQESNFQFGVVKSLQEKLVKNDLSKDDDSLVNTRHV